MASEVMPNRSLFANLDAIEERHCYCDIAEHFREIRVTSIMPLVLYFLTLLGGGVNRHLRITGLLSSLIVMGGATRNLVA